MIQIYADGELVYDSRLETYELQALKVTDALNKGGTAEFTMPPRHPAYNRFVAYRTIVEIYRDEELRFRGRALYAADDFYNCRTITCEGELCLFQDAISRPYLYQDDPAVIFAAVVQDYNSQMDDFKHFKAGTVTVTDPNDYIRLESENAETVLDTLNKLLERCGGYFVFTTDTDGARVINWLEEIERESNQVIEFGENLLNFSRSSANTELATGIVPYGAKNEETGERLTIESVWGKDYLTLYSSQKIRGTIFMTQTWDDVTDADTLRVKAQQALWARQYLVTSLELTALDLSYLDKSLDGFRVGDTVRVRSTPHGVDDTFQLTEKTEDLLDPSQSTITLGKTVNSLTAASVAGDVANLDALQEMRVSITADYKLNTAKVVKEAKAEMQTLIEQTSESVLLQVSKTYATTESVSSSLKVLADSITMKVSGSLGSEASITLSVNGETREAQKIDMTNVREAFAGDTSAVIISAGKITFNAGTLIINSSKFSLSDDGAVTATDATITGEVTTIDAAHSYEKYTSKLSGGKLEMYFNDVLCGLIKSQYRDWYADNPGLALRVEEGGKYLMFAHLNSSGAYVIDYYLNCGFSTLYDEMHIFQTSARFLEKVYFSGSGVYFHGAYLYDNYYIKSCASDGTVGEELIGYNGERVNVGSVGCTMMLRGTTVYLKNTSTTVTSDRNAKNSIEALPEEYVSLFDALRPVRYKYNGGTSGRYHVGFIAQEVAQALTEAGLTSQDFAGYVDIDKTGELGLSYDEFIALLCLKIKRQEQRIAALETAATNGGN